MEKKIKDIVFQFIDTSMNLDVFRRKIFDLIEAKPKQEWFAVPPYKNEGWQILNSKGELVATFEEKEDCLAVVELYNNEQNG